MSTAELVKKLMDAGASSEVVAICIQAVEDAYEEATAPKKRIRKRKPAAEVVNLQR